MYSSINNNLLLDHQPNWWCALLLLLFFVITIMSYNAVVVFVVVVIVIKCIILILSLSNTQHLTTLWTQTGCSAPPLRSQRPMSDIWYLLPYTRICCFCFSNICKFHPIMQRKCHLPNNNKKLLTLSCKYERPAKKFIRKYVVKINASGLRLFNI